MFIAATPSSSLLLSSPPQGKRADAVRAYEAALALDAKCALAHYNLGTAHHDAGRLHAAVECFERALAAEPTHADAAFALGLAHQDDKQLAEALRFFEVRARRHRRGVTSSPSWNK